ncbi:MAG: Rrf2 family transcriptional regulator, partial [Pseudomonadota bacterium]
MKLSDGVEWGAHCVMLLAALPGNARLSGRALADFHGVPESYLLKHLKSLAQAGILASAPGPNGGYGLARR